MKYLFALLVAGLLFGCASKKETSFVDSMPVNSTKSQPAIADTLPKKVPRVVAPFTAKDTVSSIENFPHSWTELDWVDGEYVLHDYCEAENPYIFIEKREDGNYLLDWSYGQIWTKYSIRKFECIAPRKFLITCSPESDTSQILTATVRYRSDGSAMAAWGISSEMEESDGEGFDERDSDEVRWHVSEGANKFKVIEEKDCDY